MNLYKAEVTDGELVVLDDAGEVAFRIPCQAEEFAGRSRLRVGIRPHRVYLTDDAGPTSLQGVTIVRGEVLSNHWLGDHSHVGVAIGNVFLIAVADRHISVPVGSRAILKIPRGAIHIFDEVTGIAVAHGLRNP